jgi:hypothetical protein
LLGGSLLFAGPSPAQRNAAEDRLITVLNPEATARVAPRIPLAPRLDALEGKTIYLVDTNWGGFGDVEKGYGLMQAMQAWFSRNMPKVKTVMKLKRNNFVTDDPALWKEISAKKADGVVIGVAG